MRLIISSETNERVELEEIGGGAIRVRYENPAANVTVEKTESVREVPNITTWLFTAKNFLADIRKGVTVTS